MKKQFAALLTALSLLPTLALAQDYYTLPEIREQAKDGWHETYTDRYGRETVVDIDVEVYGEETSADYQNHRRRLSCRSIGALEWRKSGIQPIRH